MKTSIEHLPKESKERLQELVYQIRQVVPEVQFIILYGSYARGEQVEYDQKTEFGLRTSFMSDIDIAVLTPASGYNESSVQQRLKIAASKYASGYNLFARPTVQFFTESIEEFNQAISEGRYFYTDIATEGIVLYDSGDYNIEPVRELNYQEIVKLSQEYFGEKFEAADDFLVAAKALYKEKRYLRCAYLLHQAAENYLLSIILTSSLYSPKEHNIDSIIERSALFTPIAVDIFHTRTPEDEKLLNLLEKSYIEGRYNKDFEITKEDIDRLIQKIDRLHIQTDIFCIQKIQEYKTRAEREKI